MSQTILIGMAFAAAGYAATGFEKDRPSREESAALEEYEATHGMHHVVQTYFQAWCDAGRPLPKRDVLGPLALNAHRAKNNS